MLSNKLEIGAKVLVEINSYNGPKTPPPHCYVSGLYRKYPSLLWAWGVGRWWVAGDVTEGRNCRRFTAQTSGDL